MNAFIKTSPVANIGSIGMFAVAFASAVAALYVMLSGAGVA
jgi:hypothetical protein